MLPGRQQELISKVAATSKGPIILVLMSGGPADVWFAKTTPISSRFCGLAIRAKLVEPSLLMICSEHTIQIIKTRTLYLAEDLIILKY